jgi:DNA primase
MALDIVGRYPTVPEYYQEFIDKSVDLTTHPKQCCPFHKEDTPSFSYDFRTGRWSCFGACHTHGDVIDMHQRVFKMQSREKAEEDLARRCRVDRTKLKVETKETIYVNKQRVDLKTAYMKASLLANCPERWDRLDEVMTKYPVPEDELYNLAVEWTNNG